MGLSDAARGHCSQIAFLGCRPHRLIAPGNSREAAQEQAQGQAGQDPAWLQQGAEQDFKPSAAFNGWKISPLDASPDRFLESGGERGGGSGIPEEGPEVIITVGRGLGIHKGPFSGFGQAGIIIDPVLQSA